MEPETEKMENEKSEKSKQKKKEEKIQIQHESHLAITTQAGNARKTKGEGLPPLHFIQST
jgi:hypothetical protein